MMEGILVPRINSVSLWLVDDHVWKLVNPTKININGFENIFFTSVAINTHRGWVHLDLEPSKEFYKLLARGFKPTSHAKIKLDRKNRRGYSTYPLGRRSRSTGLGILSLLMLMRIL
jgi:hypothetical protein